MIQLEERLEVYLREKRDRFDAALNGARQLLVDADPSTIVEHMNTIVEDSRRLRATQDKFVSRALQKLDSNSTPDSLVANMIQFSSGNELNQVMGSIAQSLLDTEEPDPSQPAPSDEQDEPKENGQRKLSAILSFPTLAKYFGLCADIVVDPSVLAGLKNPVFAVELLGSDEHRVSDNTLAWTAYQLETTGSNLYFGPRSIPQSLLQAAVTNGMVDLNEKLDDGSPAYVLATSGTPHTFARLDEKARLMAKRINSGRADPDNFEPLPARSTRGVVLYNKTKKIKALAKLALESSSMLSDFTINHTEDLIQGMRVDGHLDAADDNGSIAPSGPSRWRPLTERIVQFSDNDVHPAFLNNPNVRTVSYRDQAVIMAPEEEKEE